jgi:predicted short-subunit dehydrogenase-like oxidoreductase (DUF2520 family)
MSTPSSASSAPASVAVIGAGRLGGVLARALRAAGFDVRGPLGRDGEIPSADIALLCVPDAAIATAATTARDHARLVGHASGATSLDAVDFSIHPLQTFTGSESPAVFRGIGCAVDARTDEVLAVATGIAEALGARPFRVTDADRAGYHAAASTASNLLLAVLDAAEQLAARAGVDDSRALFAPLVRRTVDNWVDAGAAASLTGPIARGDEETVARQRAAVPLQLLPLFDQLCTSTRELAGRKDAA